MLKLASYLFIYLVIMDLTSAQNKKNSKWTETSDKILKEVSGGPLVLAELMVSNVYQ